MKFCASIYLKYFFSYYDIVQRYVPSRHVTPETIAAVEKRHAELAGRHPLEVKRVFMQFVRSSPLFGTTLFAVNQWYTNQIPSLCWLGVSFNGIQIMARFATVWM
jgi:hypothetical protein